MLRSAHLSPATKAGKVSDELGLYLEVTPRDSRLWRVSSAEAPALEHVGEHGEFKRGTIAEGKETYSLLSYGKVVGITRQTVINDDLGAFTRVPRSLGMQAANLESDLVWHELLINPTMSDGQPLFSAAQSNIGIGSRDQASRRCACNGAMMVRYEMIDFFAIHEFEPILTVSAGVSNCAPISRKQTLRLEPQIRQDNILGSGV